MQEACAVANGANLRTHILAGVLLLRCENGDPPIKPRGQQDYVKRGKEQFERKTDR